MGKLDELVERYSSLGSEGAPQKAIPHASRLVFLPKAKTLIGDDAWLALRTLTPAQEATGSRGKKGSKGVPSGTETAMKWAELSIARYYTENPGEEFDGKGEVVFSKHRDLLWELLGPAGRAHVLEQFMELSGMLAPEDDEAEAEGKA